MIAGLAPRRGVRFMYLIGTQEPTTGRGYQKKSFVSKIGLPRLPEIRFQVLRTGKHNDALTNGGIDICEQPRDFGPGDFKDVTTELLSSLSNQILAHLFHHSDALVTFGQLSLGRSQNPFEPNEDDVLNNERPNIGGATAHELLLKFDNGITNGVFHFTSREAIFHTIIFPAQRAASDTHEGFGSS